MNWTPVTERLPDDDTTVMIAGRDFGVWIGYHDGDDGWLDVHGSQVTVTHWAELPEGPG